jgi:hypothetical protein
MPRIPSPSGAIVGALWLNAVETQIFSRAKSRIVAVSASNFEVAPVGRGRDDVGKRAIQFEEQTGEER